MKMYMASKIRILPELYLKSSQTASGACMLGRKLPQFMGSYAY